MNYYIRCIMHKLQLIYYMFKDIFVIIYVRPIGYNDVNYKKYLHT